MRALTLLPVLTLTLAACAPTPGASPGPAREPRACFLPQQAVSFRSDGNQAIHVRTIGRDVFRLDSAGCLELDSTFQVGLAPGPAAGSRLCEGDAVDLVVRGFSRPSQTCPARVERRLTEAEVEALPTRDRP